MRSAFGVEHGSISKSENDTVDDILTPVLPGSTVRAYDNSRRKKHKAAAQNFAIKTGGAAIGAGLGTLAAVKTKGKIPFLNRASTIRGHEINAPMKQGYYASTLGAGGAGLVGGAAGNASLKQIKRDPEFKYRER